MAFIEPNPIQATNKADGNGTITIVTPKRISVRVYTILGQVVSQATLQPGTSELRLGSRGIYLVRIGNMTQKVAI